MAQTGKFTRRPRVACEISAGQIFVARMADTSSQVEVLLTRAIPPEAVLPSLTNPNIVDPGAVRTVLADALAAAAGRTRDVSLVVPDAAVRVVLLEFDTLPEKKAEADAVVRFRLKRSLPFEVENAALSYHVERSGAELRLVAAVMLNSVLQEYENVVRDCGYMPGVVLPSTLAALGNIEDGVPTMAVNVAQGTTTIAILENDSLLLYRTLDHDAGLSPERLAETVYPSVVFFQDTYGRPVQRILLAGIDPVQGSADVLAAETGVQVAELANPAIPDTGSTVNRGRLSGLMGALVQ